MHGVLLATVCTLHYNTSKYSLIMLINSWFIQEAGLKMEDGGKEPFSELNRILDSLKQRDLGPALEWARSHRESLDTQVKKFMSSAVIPRIIQNVHVCPRRYARIDFTHVPYQSLPATGNQITFDSLCAFYSTVPFPSNFSLTWINISCGIVSLGIAFLTMETFLYHQHNMLKQQCDVFSYGQKL